MHQIDYTLPTLTENTIKRITLEFLRAYYRYRPRTGDAKGLLDLVTGDGIISDGQITFPLEDGKEFIASFEATSAEVRSEVFYQKQKNLLWYDSLSLGGIFAAFALSWSYRSEWMTLQDLGYILTFFKYVLSFLLFGLVYYVAAGWRARYRYIHAVEQFKQFYANEQWISIAEDVFIGATEKETELFQKYFSELKNQCVNYGFGLIEIKKDNTAHLIITPAREEVFEAKRTVIPFLEKIKLPSIPGSSRYSKLWKSFYDSTKSMTGSATSIFRFQQTFWKQWSLIASCVILAGYVFYLEYQRQPIDYIAEEEFIEEIKEKQATRSAIREPDDYVEIDTAHGIEPPMKVEPYLYLIDTERKNRARKSSKEKFYANTNGKQISYGCARFSNLEGKYYMILDSDYEDLTKAMARLEELQKAGIEANCIWSGCFDNIIPCYLVYLDLLYTEEYKATRSVNGLAQNLKDADLYRGGVMVLPVEKEAEVRKE